MLRIENLGLGDLRESGSIEQDADNVFFLFEPNQEHEGRTTKINLKIAKQRSGETGIINLEFDKGRSYFNGDYSA